MFPVWSECCERNLSQKVGEWEAKNWEECLVDKMKYDMLLARLEEAWIMNMPTFTTDS